MFYDAFEPKSSFKNNNQLDTIGVFLKLLDQKHKLYFSH